MKSSNPRDITALVVYVIKALVDFPDEVRIIPVRKESETTFTVHVARSDIGKLIGKQGRTARSLRVILSEAGTKENHRYVLDLPHSDEFPVGSKVPVAEGLGDQLGPCS